MNSFKTSLFLLVFISILGLASNVLAHMPRIADSDVVNVKNAEFSQAFYGELKGQPATYVINSENDFVLYANILVPKSTNPKGRYSFNIFKVTQAGEEAVGSVDGNVSDWPEFFEEFAGDYYLKGPEFEKSVKAGTYKIFVYGSDNLGKYVLATGKQEVFTMPETIKDIWILPKLKISFFNTSVFTLFTTPLKWLFIIPLALLLIILISIVLLSIRIIKKRKNKLVEKEG